MAGPHLPTQGYIEYPPPPPPATRLFHWLRSSLSITEKESDTWSFKRCASVLREVDRSPLFMNDLLPRKESQLNESKLLNSKVIHTPFFKSNDTVTSDSKHQNEKSKEPSLGHVRLQLQNWLVVFPHCVIMFCLSLVLMSWKGKQYKIKPLTLIL